ncbi:MAG: heparinase II/III family protein, partial [Lentisphaerae bacterium]|nr:heparinase II/III family protein [Lentisphaerota bacterium]
MLMTPELLRRLRDNVENLPWARQFRDDLVRAAGPWRALPDEALWNLMFGPAPTRSWDVWSNGHCPTCKKPVPLYNWLIDGWAHPWKVLCPECKDVFPKNDFHAFYRSGLNRQNLFDPALADRSLLFNAEHPEPSDPLRGYGVDDGEGYVEGENRWRFVGAYLIYGQWKHLVLGGISNLSAAYLVTGEPVYARQAAILLDRVAELYPSFDHKAQAWVEELFRTDGYVSTWHDACEETREMALAYAGIRDAIRADPSLCEFLSAMARRHDLSVSKTTPDDICRNIENGILRDPIRNPHKIHSNYPRREIALMTFQIVLDWPNNRAEILSQIDDMVKRATAVDGVTGEKGLSGYSVYVIQSLAMFLAQMDRLEPGFLAELLRRHPALRGTYRFHIDTWCLQQYYPRIGDCGWFAHRELNYLGVSFQKKWNPAQQRGLGWALHMPSMFSFLWKLHELTGDPAYVQALYRAALEVEEFIGPNPNDRPPTTAPLSQDPKGIAGLPYDFFEADPAAFQRRVKEVIARHGTTIRLGNVLKMGWRLAILRNGEGAEERAAWLNYDTCGAHGHNDGLNIGLFAKGLDLLPDFGYPPLQYAHAGEPRTEWYLATAAHNTVVIDGQNHLWKVKPIGGRCTLWGDGKTVSVARAACADFLAAKTIAEQVEVYGADHQQIGLYCHAPARVTRVRVHEKPEPPWMLSFEDTFQRATLGPDWTALDGEWTIENGALVGHGSLLCLRRFRGYHRVEIEAAALTEAPCDLSVFLQANEEGWKSGVFFGFGSDMNTGSKLLLRGKETVRSEARISPGRTHRILCECEGSDLRHVVD